MRHMYNNMKKRICTFSFSSDMWKQGVFSHTEFKKNFENSKPWNSESKEQKKGLLRVKTNSSHAKIQTCTFPVGQYAKFQ